MFYVDFFFGWFLIHIIVIYLLYMHVCLFESINVLSYNQWLQESATDQVKIRRKTFILSFTLHSLNSVAFYAACCYAAYISIDLTKSMLSS